MAFFAVDRTGGELDRGIIVRDEPEKRCNLAGEAVEIGFEDRWAQLGRKLRYGLAVAAHRVGKHDFTAARALRTQFELPRVQTRYRRPSKSSGSIGSEIVLPLFRLRTSST